jgi:chemotaxis protein histidine kinase CheA
MQSLRDAVRSFDRESMKIAAHSLKGLTGNLGLTPLFEASGALMNALGPRLAAVAELDAEDLTLVLTFIDALVTKTRLRTLASSIS